VIKPETTIVQRTSDGAFNRMRTHWQGGSVARFCSVVDNNDVRDWYRSAAAPADSARSCPGTTRDIAAAADVDLQHLGVVVFQVVQVDPVLFVL